MSIIYLIKLDKYGRGNFYLLVLIFHFDCISIQNQYIKIRFGNKIFKAKTLTHSAFITIPLLNYLYLFYFCSYIKSWELHGCILIIFTPSLLLIPSRSAPTFLPHSTLYPPFILTNRCFYLSLYMPKCGVSHWSGLDLPGATKNT